MFTSTPAADRQPQASDGNHWQSGPGVVAERATMHLLDACVVQQAASFSACLMVAAQQSGKDDYQIADEIHICHGYMSRFMRSVAQQWARRLVAFMRATKSLAPLQWIAEQMGCDLVVRARVSAELAAARARVLELERQGLVA